MVIDLKNSPGFDKDSQMLCRFGLYGWLKRWLNWDLERDSEEGSLLLTIIR